MPATDRGDYAPAAVHDDPRPEHVVDRMQEAVEEAAALAEETGGLGHPGRPMNRRSPFFVGMAGAAGVAVTYGLAELLVRARSVLVLIGLALFIAAGLDPAVTWLTRHRFPRWAAVATVLLALLAVLGGFLAAAIPPLAAQASRAGRAPAAVRALAAEPQFGTGQAERAVSPPAAGFQACCPAKGSALVGGVLGAGKLVLSAATSVILSPSWWSTS